VKAAGVSFQYLYDVSPFQKEETPESAQQTTSAFKRLRSNPPVLLRSSFFPLERSEVKARMKASPALLRPMLKTDQGPAGNFLGFNIKDQITLTQSRFSTASGLAIPEIYFQEQLIQHPELMPLVAQIQNNFLQGDEDAAILALEQLSIECEAKNITFQRTADKGRLPFFFIRPAQTSDGPIVFPLSLTKEIEAAVPQVVSQLETKALLTKDLVKQGYRVEQAMDIADNTHMEESNTVGSMLYFQPDVIVRNDGSFVIDKINIPDVVFFLTQIHTVDNSAFNDIRAIVENVQAQVFTAILERFRQENISDIVIMTRDAVVDNAEDTLELLEIQCIAEKCAEENIDTSVSRISESPSLQTGSHVLLLNTSPTAEGFNDLLVRVARDELTCFPDPFTYLFREEAHTYPHIRLNTQQLNNLRAIVEPISDDVNHPELAYRQHCALEHFLSRLGFDDEDIFYFTDGSGSQAPVFRYDIRSFSLALNEYTEAQSLELKGLRYKLHDACVVADDGPRLSAFRFMFIQNP